jgi:site-specific recombinase
MFLMTPVTLFLASVIALTETDPDGKYDLRSYYLKNYRSIYTLLIIIIVLGAGGEYLLLDQYPFTIRNMTRAAAAVVLLVGIAFSCADSSRLDS